MYNSGFPFHLLAMREVADLMIKSVRLGDREFADACREEILRRPTSEYRQTLEEYEAINAGIKDISVHPEFHKVITHCAMCESPNVEDRIAIVMCPIHGKSYGWITEE